MTKERRTLAEMAADTARKGTGSISCPKCGCGDFRIYRTSQGSSTKFQYKSCRHCGHKILTASQTVERIVRDVSSHQVEDDGDMRLSVVG